jgi:hypothetical protein
MAVLSEIWEEWGSGQLSLLFKLSHHSPEKLEETYGNSHFRISSYPAEIRIEYFLIKVRNVIFLNLTQVYLNNTSGEVDEIELKVREIIGHDLECFLM